MNDVPTTTPEVVRATRVEIVDHDGRVRAVLGPLESPDPTTDVFGLALVDEVGRQRVWVSLDGAGPALVFDLAGNNAITFGVNDPTADALHVGAYLHVSDLDGTPVLGWQVEEDGSVLARFGGPTR
jgi:hypothetical protein